jgi:hypothetical protein
MDPRAITQLAEIQAIVQSGAVIGVVVIGVAVIAWRAGEAIHVASDRLPPRTEVARER